MDLRNDVHRHQARIGISIAFPKPHFYLMDTNETTPVAKSISQTANQPSFFIVSFVKNFMPFVFKIFNTESWKADRYCKGLLTILTGS